MDHSIVSFEWQPLLRALRVMSAKRFRERTKHKRGNAELRLQNDYISAIMQLCVNVHFVAASALELPVTACSGTRLCSDRTASTRTHVS